MDDDIDTEKKYRMISKTGVILCPHDLRTRPFTKNGNFKDFCFKFIRDGADSYRIKGIRNENEEDQKILNVVNAFSTYGDKSVRLERDDGIWGRHRRFRAVRNDEGYYQFLNEESRTLLGIDTKSGKIKAFYCSSGDSQEDNHLFKIERVEVLPLISSPYLSEKKKNLCTIISNLCNSWGWWFIRKITRN
jgi:hypothetical protein